MKTLQRGVLLLVAAMMAVCFCGSTAFATSSGLKIESASLSDKSSTVDDVSLTVNDDSIERELAFHQINDEATYTVVVENDSNKHYRIDDIVLDNDNSLINFEVDDHTGETINAHASMTVSLRATYAQAVSDVNERTQDSSAKLRIIYTIIDGEEADNPVTQDDVVVFTTIFLGLSCGVLMIARLSKRRKGIVGLAVVLVVGVSIMLLPAIASAEDGYEEFSIGSTYHFYDRLVVKVNNGTTTTEQIINYGESIAEPEAAAIAGYDVDGWKVNGEAFDFSTAIVEDIEIEPNYVARNDTKYFVYHMKQKADGSGYDEAEKLELSGTTDTDVTPEVRTYDHFISPDAQTKTITGDGQMKVEYFYAREQHRLTLIDAEYIESEFTTGDYNYGTEIELEAKVRKGFKFIRWTNGSTDRKINVALEGDLEIGPVYEEVEIETVFEQDAACRFNGPSMNISGEGCEQYSDKTYIDTGVSLFSSSEYQKDFIVSFNIDEINMSNLGHRATLFNATLEDSSRQWPGIVLRRNDSTGNFVLGSNVVKNGKKLSNKKILFPIAGVEKITLVRKDMNFCYQINDEEMVFVNSYKEHNEFFELSSWMGASIEDGVTYRQFTGVLSGMKIQTGTIDDTIACEEN